MALELKGYIDLPRHAKKGGFDHADVHHRTNRLYVAHTANDAIDVIDCATDEYLYSIPHLTGVAGVLVSNERDLVFSSNRGENTVAIFSPQNERQIMSVATGLRPNGLSYDSERDLLLVANLGDSGQAGPFSVSIINVENKRRISDISMPGPTRWTVFDPTRKVFFVNVAGPRQIVVISSTTPDRICNTVDVPVNGPHGLAIDPQSRRLFCACDGGKLVMVNAENGELLSEMDLSGKPDATWFNPALNRVYVAAADPGVLDIFDAGRMEHLQTVPTEKGAKTTAFDATRNKLFVFLPQTHRAAVYIDEQT